MKTKIALVGVLFSGTCAINAMNIGEAQMRIIIAEQRRLDHLGKKIASSEQPQFIAMMPLGNRKSITHAANREARCSYWCKKLGCSDCLRDCWLWNSCGECLCEDDYYEQHSDILYNASGRL